MFSSEVGPFHCGSKNPGPDLRIKEMRNIYWSDINWNKVVYSYCNVCSQIVFVRSSLELTQIRKLCRVLRHPIKRPIKPPLWYKCLQNETEGLHNFQNINSSQSGIGKILSILNRFTQYQYYSWKVYKIQTKEILGTMCDLAPCESKLSGNTFCSLQQKICFTYF